MLNKYSVIRRSLSKILGYAIIIPLLFFTGCEDKKQIKDIIYSSDMHVSLLEGRFAYMTPKYKEFLTKFAKEENIFFFNGDLIDNAYSDTKGKVRAGDRFYYTNELQMFLKLTQELTARYNNKVLLNFGTGHDFGDIELLESLTQTKRIGRYRWGEVDLIWFTVYPSVFYENHNEFKALQQDYYILENLLKESKNVILFSHVPLRTKKTYQLGQWPNGINLTIPHNDHLYKIIDNYQENILAVFSGHIHSTYKDNYKEIPIYSFAFMDQESFCRIRQQKNIWKFSPEIFQNKWKKFI